MRAPQYGEPFFYVQKWESGEFMAFAKTGPHPGARIHPYNVF